VTKKEAKSRYTKTKKNIKKNKEMLDLHSSLNNINESMNKNIVILNEIHKSAKLIVKKSSSINADKLVDSLPAENLRELEGDFSKKITFRDINDLAKMHKKSMILIDDQQSLERKHKILNIELLQKQIELLLDENK
jgi:hypothetical protein